MQEKDGYILPKVQGLLNMVLSLPITNFFHIYCRYTTGYAKLGTSSCKKCKQKIDKGGLRIGKVVSNPFSDEGGDMKQWYHPQCMFETLKRARATTKKIEEPDDLEGFTEIEQSDKDLINKLIKGEVVDWF